MNRVSRVRYGLFLSLCLFMTLPLHADDSTLLKEIEFLGVSAAETTQKLSDVSEKLLDIRQKKIENIQKISVLTKKTQRYKSKRIRFKENRRAYLSLAVRMSKTPPQLFLGLTQTNHQMVLGLHYLRSVFTTLQKKDQKHRRVKTNLREERLTLTHLTDILEKEESNFIQEENILKAQKEEIEKKLIEKEEVISQEKQRLAKLARTKNSVKAILSSIPQEPEQKNPILIQKGAFLMPVSGHILTYFGEQNTQGHKSHGLYIDVPHNSDVKSPFQGKVAFSGAFRHYSNVVIIDHNQGYHSLLMGFQNVSVKVGDLVQKGQILGQTGLDLFFLELRRHLQPIDPMPWFTS